MATKTQRILDLLPGTFTAQPANSPLATLARTYGQELQGAENALAAIMRAHWCDQADLGVADFSDLPKFAALYGLAPHPDDGVEEFRRRLKLWVRLILDGPATVRGLLRATSILTGLEVDDSDAAFDAWWRRDDDRLTTTHVSRRDAGPAIFGGDRSVAIGADATPAQISGTVALPQDVDLSEGAILRVAFDKEPMVEIDLAAAPPADNPDAISERINTTLGDPVASLSGGRLILTSTTSGKKSALHLGEGPGDAAAVLLGRLPLRYLGTEARSARFAGDADLSAGIDLSQHRFLRLRIDGTHLAEIDCAGADPATTTPDEIVDAINAALGASVASHDGQVVVVQSPTTGIGSSIAFQQPAAQDATARIFGTVPTIVIGAQAAPGTVIGTTDLSAGVDLSTGSRLVVSVDDGPASEVDCAGPDPTNTQLPEIVAAINEALRADIARHNGRNLILTGLDTGASGALEIGQAAQGDAALTLLGLPPRRAQGRGAQRAQLRGTVDLSDGISLAARPLVQLAIDHHQPVTFDLSDAANTGPLDAAAIAAAINGLEDAPSARADDGYLVLESAQPGGTGRIELLPLQKPRARRFVSRVPILEDAAYAVLGFLSAEAESAAPTKARITGAKSLTRGVDLGAGRYLRVSIDGAAPVEVDCVGIRPRTTTADEVLGALNAALGDGVAALSSDNRLSLMSPTSGTGSRVTLSPPRFTDALAPLLGVDPVTVFGSDARQVSFTGTADLSAGVDLSAASHLRLAIDGGAALEIDCAGPDPATTSLGQIAIAINIALGVNVASHDGVHLLLTSPTKGTDSQLAILTPTENDATATLLGIEPERRYQGAAAEAAMIRGLADLAGGIDLTRARFLRLGVDTTGPLEIDCAATAPDPANATADEVVTAINAAVDGPVASAVDGHLVLKAPTPGPSSRLVLEQTTAGNAAQTLFGEGPVDAQGEAASRATLTGKVDLRAGVDLGERSVLRLSVNDALPTDIDIAGEAPEATSPDEIVEAINARFADMAEITADGQLQLAAPDGATLSLLPPRHFELVEYPPEETSLFAPDLVHADAIFVENTGAVETVHDVTLAADAGVESPGLVNLETGWELRLRDALPPGARGDISVRSGRLRASITRPEDQPARAGRVLGLPLLPHLDHPRDESRMMATGADGRRHLVITGHVDHDTIRLSELSRRDSAPKVRMGPATTLPAPLPSDLAFGRLVTEGTELALADLDGIRIARVEPVTSQPVQALVDHPVAIVGQRVGAGSGSRILAEAIHALYDLQIIATDDPSVTEDFGAVVLVTSGLPEHLSVLHRINSGPDPSTLVRAEVLDQSEAAHLPRGNGRRLYVDCLAARFDAAEFDKAHFAGGRCLEQGIFDVSRFAESPRAASTAVFAPASGGGVADVGFNWQSHAAASAQINLPLEMPARYGARFDMDRFGLTEDAPETISGLVTEPAGDEDHFTKRLDPEKAIEDRDSRLLVAAPTDAVPIGFDAAILPFSRPKFLKGGRAGQPARLFLSDPGVPGFIEVSASEAGAHGNRISVVICDSGPGRFDLLVAFDGARFENARQRVNGPALTGIPDDDLAKPGPRGVQHLKAAGVRLSVTRDGTPPEDPNC
ncbi:hypothetical protein KX928_21865 [Roseobacter sp. YSTF-M11]|uniref:Uncharacterized protein n=1 Tax=Roseobacter insulae TaxID=2859783 RepID=A0A9X1K0D5_9RHOB|nr:hypothetical protein [Roseobacter insulae]MBW4710446.1 hypothetical protein [Roseobacter insulae]